MWDSQTSNKYHYYIFIRIIYDILVLQSGTPKALLVSGITSDEPNPGGSSNIPNSASVSIGPASYTIIFWALIRAFIPAVRSVTKRIKFNRL